MARKIFDTSALIRHWHDSGGRSPTGKTAADAAGWAQRLIAVHDTDAIVTPVFIEFVAGVTNSVELELTRSYLGLRSRVSKWNSLFAWHDGQSTSQ